jgi:hypothetical protein
LAGAFSRLAIVQRKAKELQDEQAQQDVVTFAGTGIKQLSFGINLVLIY